MLIACAARVPSGGARVVGLSQLYGTWAKENFARPEIVESFEPDRTKIVIEFEHSEVGAVDGEVGAVDAKVGTVDFEVGTVETKVGAIDDRDFAIRMGAYRSDFVKKSKVVLLAIAANPELSIKSISQEVGFAASTVQNCINALRHAGMLVLEGENRNSKWRVIQKTAGVAK